MSDAAQECEAAFTLWSSARGAAAEYATIGEAFQAGFDDRERIHAARGAVWRDEIARLRAALDEATRSLETASRWANDEDGPQSPSELRPWLRSRARVAREALERR